MQPVYQGFATAFNCQKESGLFEIQNYTFIATSTINTIVALGTIFIYLKSPPTIYRRILILQIVFPMLFSLLVAAHSPLFVLPYPAVISNTVNFSPILSWLLLTLTIVIFSFAKDTILYALLFNIIQLVPLTKPKLKRQYLFYKKWFWWAANSFLGFCITGMWLGFEWKQNEIKQEIETWDEAAKIVFRDNSVTFFTKNIYVYIVVVAFFLETNFLLFATVSLILKTLRLIREQRSKFSGNLQIVVHSMSYTIITHFFIVAVFMLLPAVTAFLMLLFLPRTYSCLPFSTILFWTILPINVFLTISYLFFIKPFRHQAIRFVFNWRNLLNKQSIQVTVIPSSVR